MSHLSDDDFVRASLEVHLPEARVFLEQLDSAERESAEELGHSPYPLGLYTVLSEAFYWVVLRPALDSPEASRDLLVRCRDFLDELTSSRRSEVLQAVEIRVWEHLRDSEREILGWGGSDPVGPSA
ncbi:hypothetical protein AB0442_40415 [Kitasatospora sp. NPDC085895]|uniref:hypothetical protein n=1 Tax=Kitasatospora sp. NPDC085895 TaxID=3155057 RepID=UPI00344E147D